MSLKSVTLLALGLLLLAGSVAGYLCWDRIARYFWTHDHPQMALAADLADAPLAVEIGNYYFNGGTYDLTAAQAAFERAVWIDPHVLWGYYQLSRVYFDEGDLSKALPAIQRSLIEDPSNLRALYVRGLIRLYQQEYAGAEQDFSDFTKWAPKEWAGYNDLSFTLSKDGKYQAAVSAAQDGINNANGGQTNPWLFNSLGVAYLNMGRYTKAEAALAQARALASSLTTAQWIAAYPGNDPSQAQSGVDAFKKAVQDNLSEAKLFSGQ